MKKADGSHDPINGKEGHKSFSNFRLLSVLLLTLLILCVFGQAAQFDFVHYDDHVYVTDHLRVQSGLTLESIQWALTSLDAGFWQPMTWLSLMLDFRLYGFNAGGYHWTNVILHILNALLLLLVLERMTGAFWRSAFVAALFALHPLHVESVAWVAARKDVLSTFFWLFVMLGYVAYVKHPGGWRYLGVIFLFILGLMSKAMLVTLPFVLLLLDWWPLGRFHTIKSVQEKGPLKSIRSPGWLFLEKAPLLALAIGVSVATILAEQRTGALSPMVSFPLDVRLANALVSYVLYIGKMFRPTDLAVFYPHPGLWPIWAWVSSGLLLVVISIMSLRWLRAYPYFAIGWFWYLGTLVPVIGLIQVGSHGMADRYTYVPMIGLFIMMAWGGFDMLRHFRWHRLLIGGVVFILLFILSIQSYMQTRHWENAQQLFQHAIEVTKDNYVAHNNLGAVLSRQGKALDAVEQYRKALRIIPRYPEAQFNLGAALADQEQYPEAIMACRRVLEIKPDFAEAHNNLAIALAKQGDLEGAIGHFKAALMIRNDYRDAKNNLGIALRELGERQKK